MKTFGVSLHEVEQVRQRLGRSRRLAKRIDELTYIESKASGFENHLYQVMSSDLNGEPDVFEKVLEQKVLEIEQRPAVNRKIRLGYIGVPPMSCDLYEYVEKFDAHFVYNEVQREFTFPRGDKAQDIFMQYHDYTYPYDINFRLDEIKRQAAERHLNAIVHYTQAFCYRAIEDIVIKKELNIPVLTIEGDKSNCLDPRTKLRLEAFLDMLCDMKGVTS
jgi:benzoyl-CoA reductase/2-hydroxyglutaryl-CoA dehydratase subunit BcrC/BadD/HgdB